MDMCSVSMRMRTIVYRLWQVRQQLGFVVPLAAEERQWVARWLPASALPLFQTMSAADQRHSLRVCQGLLARGCADRDLLAAALLHDVGKARGRVPFWTRPVLVLGKVLAPRLLVRLAVDPRTNRALSRWRREISNAWWHAEIGAGRPLYPHTSPARWAGSRVTPGRLGIIVYARPNRTHTR